MQKAPRQNRNRIPNNSTRKQSILDNQARKPGTRRKELQTKRKTEGDNKIH